MTFIPVYFKKSEFDCHCGECETHMDTVFLKKLDALRHELGFPFHVTSGYRCPAHNEFVSSTGPGGPHTTGRAVDLSLFGINAYRVIEAAARHGMTGIGLKQHGKMNTRFIHLDDLDKDPRPNVWTYKRD